MAIPALKEIKITSFGVDDVRGEMYYGFEGLDVDGDVVMSSAISRTGEAMPAALEQINAVINAQAQAQADSGQPVNVDTYATIKAALQAAVAEELGLTP